MQELEKITYIYSVEAIGFAKSLEKLHPGDERIREFKNKSGKMYTLVADTHKAETNREFADKLRKVRSISMELTEKLPTFNVESKELSKQKEQLSEKLKEIKEKLDELLSKIIY